MRRAPTIKLDIPVRKELERLSRSRSVAVRLAERSRIVLLAAGGLDNQEIAAKLDITRQKAGRWRDRFVEDGLGGIEKDASRSGRIPSIGRRKRARIVKKTVEGKPPNATHWSRSLMARATGVSESTVGRIWRAGWHAPSLWLEFVRQKTVFIWHGVRTFNGSGCRRALTPDKALNRPTGPE